MKQLSILTICILLHFSSFSQDMAQKAIGILTECQCREIVMISRGVEKSYTASWLEGIAMEDGMIVFSKGETKHRWNAEKITFIEKGNGFIRVYLD